MFEALTFLVSLLGLSAWLVMADVIAGVRSRRRARAAHSYVDGLNGREIGEATQVLGYPTEVVPGTTGRMLYIWNDPPKAAMPPGEKMFRVMMTVNERGTITDLAWTA